MPRLYAPHYLWSNVHHPGPIIRAAPKLKRAPAAFLVDTTPPERYNEVGGWGTIAYVEEMGMPRLMRCKYCGTLQDEPAGPKICVQCGGPLAWEEAPGQPSYLRAQLELDQVSAPPDQVVERYLILTVHTPDTLFSGERARSVSGREALHFTAVLDVSGSMRGPKIEAAKRAVQDAVARLQEGDVFSLVCFSTSVHTVLQAEHVDAGLQGRVRSLVQELDAGGQTALCGGLEVGIASAAEARRATNLVLLLSDGQANVGETDVEAVGRRALAARAEGITVSTLGVGRDYNEALMAEIAIDGGGRFYHLADATQIAAYLSGELGEMTSLAARGVVATFELPPGTGLQPLSAAYPVHGHAVTLGDIPLSTSLEVVVRVLLPPQPGGARTPIAGTVNYRSPAGHALSTALNQVTVRYGAAGEALLPGVVRPVVRRVLEQMQAAGVLATAKAATRGAADAQREGEAALAHMRQYAALLGEEARELLEQDAQMLSAMALHSAPATRSKEATYAAMRLHRGSKDFDKA
jgi:Ca-activated chloride channel family protein